MRATESDLTFEQEYPKYTFAPLVALALTVTAWATRRGVRRRAESADPVPKPTRVGPAASMQVFTAIATLLVMGGGLSHVRADTPSQSTSHQAVVASRDDAPGSEINRTSDVLRMLVESYVSDGLNTYAQDMRVYGRAASISTMATGLCNGARETDSIDETRSGVSGSAVRASVRALRQTIDSHAVRALFQTARVSARDGLDAYDENFKPSSRLSLSLSNR